jgi:hypothetical protein
VVARALGRRDGTHPLKTIQPRGRA